MVEWQEVKRASGPHIGDPVPGGGQFSVTVGLAGDLNVDWMEHFNRLAVAVHGQPKCSRDFEVRFIASTDTLAAQVDEVQRVITETNAYYRSHVLARGQAGRLRQEQKDAGAAADRAEMERIAREL